MLFQGVIVQLVIILMNISGSTYALKVGKIQFKYHDCPAIAERMSLEADPFV